MVSPLTALGRLIYPQRQPLQPINILDTDTPPQLIPTLLFPATSYSWMDYRPLGYVVLHTCTDTAAYIVEEMVVDKNEPSGWIVAKKIAWYAGKSIVMWNIGFPVLEKVYSRITPLILTNEQQENPVDKTKTVIFKVAGAFFLGAALGAFVRCCVKTPFVYEKVIATAAVNGAFDGFAACIEIGSVYVVTNYLEHPHIA